jgi:hypothetical protein
VVEVLVFFFLDLFHRGLQRLSSAAGQLLRGLGEERPVELVLGLRQHHALARDELGGGAIARGEGELHGADERLAETSNDLTSGRLLFGVEAHLVADHLEPLDVGLRLLVVLGPLVLQGFVLRALERGGVHDDAASLVLERLQ